MKPLSCPYFVTTRAGQEKFPGKRPISYFFDQMTQLLAARFCVAPIRGRLESPHDC